MFPTGQLLKNGMSGKNPIKSKSVDEIHASDVPSSPMLTDEPQLHYETIESRARPARIAVLINSSDADWLHTAVRIIEFLSSIWGGKHSIIVPTDGSTIEPTFWAILEKFSPDYVYFYR